MLKKKLGVEGREFRLQAAALFAYLFRRIDQKEFIRYIDDREVSDRLLQLIKTDGEILRNCKLYAWSFHKYRHCGGPRPKRADFGVCAEDASFLRRLNLNHLDLKFEAYSLAQFNALIQETLNGRSMQEYIGKLISKKLLFLIRSYNQTRKDMETELQAATLRALYMQYPRFASELHFTNVAKRTIHNTAMSMISHHTSPSRQRLVTNSDGSFEAAHVSLETLVALEAPASYMSHIREPLEALADLGDRIRPDVQRFLLCCAGKFDEEFSSFIKEDNSKAIDVMAYSRYLSKARKFFGYSEGQVDRLFAKLRLHIQ